MKLAWLTDIHLNFLPLRKRIKFYEEIIASKADMILISGDIAEAPCISFFLREMVEYIKKPIHFVLGNHDYYFGSTETVYKEIMKLQEEELPLLWLHHYDALITLTNDTLIIGIDGWYDGRYGNFLHSDASLNDFRLIDDFFECESKRVLWHKMQELADKHAEHLLKDRLKYWHPEERKEGAIKKIIVLTHVPPFPEVCKYNGKPTDDDRLPFYSSKATGDVLIEMAVKYPETEFLVLCGHTHGKAEWTHDKHSNLTIKVGGAKYHYPEIQEIIEV